jgi:type II secretory pathway component PulF
MMQGGASLNQALRLVPGVVSREVALAIAVGQFSGKLAQALRQLPDRRLALQWLETAPRLAYPLLVLTFLLFATSFMMIFIVPKYEKIFLEFRLKLPYATELLISVSRWMTKYWWVLAFAAFAAFILTNLMMLSSRVRWNLPWLGRLYRLYARGQFLHVLGLMLQSGKPLPEILGSVTESGLLPSAVLNRARSLQIDLTQGQALADGLVRHGLATEPMRALIVSAEKANNLPWALEALGDSLTRQSARISQRLALVAFPLLVFAIGTIVALVSVAMFLPLVEILDSLGAQA